MEPLANRLSTHLESLRAEVVRLEHVLMLDADWRALHQLEARESADGAFDATGGAALKAKLLDALSSNRIFGARAKLIESIELLGEDPAASIHQAPAPLASRIVMLGEVASGPFRTRVRRKEPPSEPVVDPAASPSVVEQPLAASPLPDALELIDGLSRAAVEQLRDGGVMRFDDIARWDSAAVAHWRTQLDGIACGGTGAWIEQAAMLAAGTRTRYAMRARRGDFATLVARPLPLPEHRPISPVAVLAGAASAAAPARRRLSAADLIVELAATRESPSLSADDTFSPPPVPGARLPPASWFLLHGRADARAAIPPQSAAASEVIVIAREPAAARTTTAEPPPPRPQKLLRRLKQVTEPGRFEAEGYAAYRSVVEEASVTIVRPDETRSRAMPAAVADDRAATGYNKFLKALTGGT